MSHGWNNNSMKKQIHPTFEPSPFVHDYFPPLCITLRTIIFTNNISWATIDTSYCWQVPSFVVGSLRHRSESTTKLGTGTHVPPYFLYIPVVCDRLFVYIFAVIFHMEINLKQFSFVCYSFKFNVATTAIFHLRLYWNIVNFLKQNYDALVSSMIK